MPKQTKISATLNESLEMMAVELEKAGYSRGEMVRAGIRMLHKKEYPPYAKKKLKKDYSEVMTPEEICTDVLGGKLVDENGITYCVWKEGNFETRAPLTAIRDQIK